MSSIRPSQSTQLDERRCLRANLTLTISKAAFDAQYADCCHVPAFKLNSSSPNPEDKVKTFLREPFLRRGRKALVVRTGPSTLVENAALKSVKSDLVSGLEISLSFVVAVSILE